MSVGPALLVPRQSKDRRAPPAIQRSNSIATGNAMARVCHSFCCTSGTEAPDLVQRRRQCPPCTSRLFDDERILSKACATDYDAIYTCVKEQILDTALAAFKILGAICSNVITFQQLKLRVSCFLPHG